MQANPRDKQEDKMKKLFRTLLILALALALSTGAYADTGPKPSVTVNFENLPNEPVYGTLLCREPSRGPYSSERDDYVPTERDEVTDLAVWEAFRAYEDADGFYFLNEVFDCSDGGMRWGYYPPDNFKILLYFPESGTFLSSEAMSAYAFDSYYTAELSSEGMDVHRSYDYLRELLSLAARCVLTIALELIAALAFGFCSRRELLCIALVNTLTQIALNLAVNIVHYFSGMFTGVFIIMELFVTFVEAVIYRRELPLRGGKSARRSVGYAVTANALSAVAGLALARVIPGIF